MVTQCKEFTARIDEMPPKPGTFLITGAVSVANPGVKPVLTKRQPQGINPSILLMDLNLVQQPGTWTQNITCADVTFSEELQTGTQRYKSVEIFSDGEPIKIEHVSVTS